MLFLAGVVYRTYSPVAHEDDLFLPTRHMGSKEVRKQPCHLSCVNFHLYTRL
jgi:hypothetical protein